MRVGIDANVLLRALLNDHPRQSELARQLLDGLGPDREGYVGVSALLEMFWTLRSRYSLPRATLSEIVNRLLAIDNLEVETPEAVARAVKRFQASNCDFQDALLVERNLEVGCSVTYTFDVDASRRLPSMELLT